MKYRIKSCVVYYLNGENGIKYVVEGKSLWFWRDYLGKSFNTKEEAKNALDQHLKILNTPLEIEYID